MKKNMISIGIVFTFIIIFVSSLILLLLIDRTKQKILLCNWYDYQQNEVMTVQTKKIKYSLATPYPFSATFIPNSSDFLEQLKKSEIFVEEKECIIEGYKVQGYILFRNNNYYFLYVSESENLICIRNMICEIVHENLIVTIPLQNIFILNKKYSPISENDIKSYFAETTFDDSKLFYEKFDTEFIQIDEENQKIIISSLDIYQKRRYELYLNYKERSISVSIENNLQIIYKA